MISSQRERCVYAEEIDRSNFGMAEADQCEGRSKLSGRSQLLSKIYQRISPNTAGSN